MNTKTNHLITTLAVIVPLLSSSCVVVEESNPGSTAGSAAATSSGYAAGYEKGRADGAGGLSRTPTRHEYLYSEADRSDFFRGYEAGYNAGIR
ncbi:hypothetical protein [Haloferula rosea]|uniref:Lipoprotein n=1 Tax=Haloferula rosea TaxID=490093 RepID=A0A934RAN3_9BACT|nr:hypothetical protein [Haloferula rosea]MBK1826273.1 hypothetical protein [Haloferula rosea]